MADHSERLTWCPNHHTEDECMWTLGQKCADCGMPNPSPFYLGGFWKCYDCNLKERAKATKDWCPYTGRHTHRFKDFGTWADHNHPQCDLCDFVDTTRTLNASKT